MFTNKDLNFHMQKQNVNKKSMLMSKSTVKTCYLNTIFIFTSSKMQNSMVLKLNKLIQS